jgi:hypothetical protein
MEVELLGPDLTEKRFPKVDSVVFINDETYGKSGTLVEEGRENVLFVNPSRIACLAVHYD